MKRSSHKKILFLIFAVSSLLLGMAVPEIFRMGTGTYAGFFSLYSMQKYQQNARTGVAGAARILPYILSVRLKTFLFLWMSSFTTAGLYFHLAYCWWLAVSAGMLLALMMLREGWNGALLFGCCLLPQWMLYGMMWKREAGFLLHRLQRNTDFAPVNASVIRRRELSELARMGMLCLLGCAAEAFLGTWTMKIFLTIV